MSVNSHPGQRAAVRKRPVQDRSRRTVDAILDAAARIFTARGYAGTNTNAVAEAAGVSIGSLYQYFPNKDALLGALEERHLDDSSAALRAAARQWRAGRPTVEAWARELVDVLVAANDADLHVLLTDAAPAQASVEARVAAIVDELTTDVARLLRGWGQRPAARVRARVLVVTALRLVHDLVIRQPPGPARARHGDEVVRVLVAYARDVSDRRGSSRSPGAT